MIRTVPRTGSEEIQLYMRTYYSLLRSSHPIQLETLSESHKAIGSSLHVQAQELAPDVSALVYSSLRLPECITEVRLVMIGQIERSFAGAGYGDIGTWQRVFAPGRRRRMLFNGDDKLATFIASPSDIDDFVPTLMAYQIEWNKINMLLAGGGSLLALVKHHVAGTALNDDEFQTLANDLHLPVNELTRLKVVWGERFTDTLFEMGNNRKQLEVQMLSGSMADYRRGTMYWWEEIQHQLGEMVTLGERPVYFVSSNTHSLANLLTGFAKREENRLVQYIQHGDLYRQYEALQNQGGLKTIDNFLYYALKKYLNENKDSQRQVMDDEAKIGILRVPSRHGFDIEAQIIEVSKLRVDWLDPRLTDSADAAALSHSDAVIINVDYPLGLGAYEILNRVTERVGLLLGVYVMGKAATLNGRVGDVVIPNVVHDEHSQNTYLFQNCFSAEDIVPYLGHGSVLDNQKAVTALGTFLQNPGYMNVFYHEGYTDIEMEAGPYLSAVYEAYRPRLHPQNEIVNLYNTPFEVGFLHYASDTPMAKGGHNLGAGNLSYVGIDPTYATAIAILRRIFARESARMGA